MSEFITPLLVSEPALQANGFDQWLSTTLEGPVSWLESIVFFSIPIAGAQVPVLVIWLLAASIFFTCFLRFQPLTGLKHSIDLIRGKFSRRSDPGEVTSFQALATELSGTVGLGNIAGVAVAITVGGPGAAFWIIIAGLFGMSLKMAEAVMGVRYRKIKDDGTVAGGPMYYLRDGLKEIGYKKLGAVLATAYAVFALIGTLGAGNLFQANQVTTQLVNATGGEASFFADKNWLIGIILAAISGLVIVGGISSIARWTSKLTPAMALLYVAMTSAVLIANFTAIPEAFGLIVSSAFTGEGVAGGFLGVAVIGIQRALFSNAAGVGTAGFAHSAVKTRRPATEGFVAMWEPFVDSVIICTMTALAIVTTGLYRESTDDGIALTSASFATVVDWFPVLLTVAVVMFGFSTILSYSYYGQKAAAYLFGESKLVIQGYNLFYIVMVVVGATISLDTVVRFSDAMFFLMAFPNILGLYFLAKVLRLEILGHKIRVDAQSIVPEHQDEQVGLGDTEETEASKQAQEYREFMEAQVATGEIPVIELKEWKGSDESVNAEQLKESRAYAKESEFFDIGQDGAAVARADAPVTTGESSSHVIGEPEAPESKG